jgi:hypothetical protein
VEAGTLLAVMEAIVSARRKYFKNCGCLWWVGFYAGTLCPTTTSTPGFCFEIQSLTVDNFRDK